MTASYGIPRAPGHWPVGWTVLHTPRTGSTNADLLEIGAADPTADRVVLVADHQTAGRGRLDRRWDAPEGANLLVSVLVRDVPEAVHQVTQHLALAGADACRRLTGHEVAIKWPNDLLLGDRKLAGILAQAGAIRGRVDHVVVGIGINVAWAPDGAACLHDVSEPIDRFELLRELLTCVDAIAAGDVPRLYRERLATRGQRVRVSLPGDDVVEGTALDVEDDGRLVVLDACAVTHRIDTGDVVHLRPMT